MTKIFFSEAKRDAWVEKFISKPENNMVAVATGGFGKHIFTATVMGRFMPRNKCLLKENPEGE